ncbi:MAG: hypothetical protein C3F11_16385 [Methylocystaceae bacterium]|nr:MAG: hypothetical protein C3F11_16385 [Methylocystaceae bacterium]
MARSMIATVLLGGLAVALSLVDARAASQTPPPLVEDSFADARGGGAIYARICAGCHLSNGEGAVGAGRYPALAGNSKLAHSRYPIEIVLEGHGAMPPFKDILDDAQIAAVLNYARGPALGNAYPATIGADEVRRFRH